MPKAVPLLAVGALALGALTFTMKDDGYHLDVVMPAASNLVPGSVVQINGAPAGKVSSLEARDGKAVIGLDVDDEFAPLHDGTTVRISWKATLGERIVDLAPGPDTNPELPDGSMIEGTVDRVELDQVLAALDAPTRAHLQSLLSRLDATLSGSEGDLRSTLQSAGPAVQALGEVLRGVGDDGPSIRSLVVRLRELTSAVASRRSDLSGSVDRMASAVQVIAAQRVALRQLLAELPPTLDTANVTLGKVPSTVDAVVPLLDALQPATAKLPGVAHELSPLLRDLRPTVTELRPTLTALDQLLGGTPRLFRGLSSVAPQVGSAGQTLSPMLAYLRPYTPELAGWLSNWGSAAANYDANGHYLRAFGQEGSTSLNHNPGVLPPGITRHRSRIPGEAEGQPWVDANGSEMR